MLKVVIEMMAIKFYEFFNILEISTCMQEILDIILM